MAHQRVPLVLQPGLASIDTSVATKGRYRDNANTRFWQGKPETIGGCERIVDQTLSGVCRAVIAYTTETGDTRLAFGTNSDLQVIIGGELFTVTPTDFVAGAVDGTGGDGWGTGGYGLGAYSEPSTADFFPMTWALQGWADSTCMAAPRGGKIYWWQGDTATPAAQLENSPGKVTDMLVTPQVTVMALGAELAVAPDGVTRPGPFNPLCIRESDAFDPTTWFPTSENVASQTVLDGAGRLIAGRVMGLDYVFAWTDSALYQGVWTGDPSQPRAWSLVSAGCGLIGPKAVVTDGQTAFWLDPAGQAWMCPISGEPQAIVSPLQADMMANLAAGQNDKIVASRCNQFQEIRWDYPDARDGQPGVENSRSVVLSLESLGALSGPIWWRYAQPRTAYVDAGPGPDPIGVDPAGNVFWQERGVTYDGGSFRAFVQSSAQYFDAGQTRMRVDSFMPDLQGQQGPVSVTFYTREFPQGPATVSDTYVCAADDQEIDVDFVEGRLIEVLVESEGTPNHWRMGQPSFWVCAAGER